MTFFANIRRAQLRRKAARQLRDLPPYLLRDIGIEPEQINDAVTGMLNAGHDPEAAQATPKEVPRPIKRPAPDLLRYKASVFSSAEWPDSRRHAA